VIRLYGYWRSSASYRVRIGLELKGLHYESVPVNLLRDGGEQRAARYRAINPQGLVPTLEDGPQRITQSLAILEYLEETAPEPPLLPRGAAERARVRSLAQVVASDTHPLANLRVLQYLTEVLGRSPEERHAWIRHWLAQGLAACEALLAGHPATGRHCHGDAPTLADVCLVPQLYNARRFDCDLSGYPTLLRIEGACLALPAFVAAHPSRQGDAVAG
jgi:maleylacetoacetate isomerase